MHKKSKINKGRKAFLKNITHITDDAGEEDASCDTWALLQGGAWGALRCVPDQAGFLTELTILASHFNATLERILPEKVLAVEESLRAILEHDAAVTIRTGHDRAGGSIWSRDLLTLELPLQVFDIPVVDAH